MINNSVGINNTSTLGYHTIKLRGIYIRVSFPGLPGWFAYQKHVTIIKFLHIKSRISFLRGESHIDFCTQCVIMTLGGGGYH